MVGKLAVNHRDVDVGGADTGGNAWMRPYSPPGAGACATAGLDHDRRSYENVGDPKPWDVAGGGRFRLPSQYLVDAYEPAITGCDNS